LACAESEERGDKSIRHKTLIHTQLTARAVEEEAREALGRVGLARRGRAHQRPRLDKRGVELVAREETRHLARGQDLVDDI
jgi:hypothetical protein